MHVVVCVLWAATVTTMCIAAKYYEEIFCLCRCNNLKTTISAVRSSLGVLMSLAFERMQENEMTGVLDHDSARRWSIKKMGSNPDYSVGGVCT